MMNITVPASAARLPRREADTHVPAGGTDHRNPFAAAAPSAVTSVSSPALPSSVTSVATAEAFRLSAKLNAVHSHKENGRQPLLADARCIPRSGMTWPTAYCFLITTFSTPVYWIRSLTLGEYSSDTSPEFGTCVAVLWMILGFGIT